MKRLVKSGEIILDGTLSKEEKEKLILEKFEKQEELEEELGVDIYRLFKDKRALVYDEEDNKIVLAQLIRIDLDGFLYLTPLEPILGQPYKSYYRAFSNYGKSWWYVEVDHQ